MTRTELIEKLADTMDRDNAAAAVDAHDRAVFRAGWDAAMMDPDRDDTPDAIVAADYAVWVQTA